MWIWMLIIKGRCLLKGRTVKKCHCEPRRGEAIRLRRSRPERAQASEGSYGSFVTSFLRTTLRVGLLRRLRLLAMTGGQVILEFTFCMIIIMLMIYGLTKVAFWTGKDFAARSISHDNVLVAPIAESYGSP